MQKTLGYFLLAGLILVLGLWGVGMYHNATTDPQTLAQERLTSDRLGCMSRVGIRRDPPEGYTASKATHALAFAYCMAGLGYRGEDLVP
jgi:hypothetical protein